MLTSDTSWCVLVQTCVAMPANGSIGSDGHLRGRNRRGSSATMLRCWIVALLAVLPSAVKAAESAESVPDARNMKPTHPFMNVETSCTGESLLVMASFQEPFYGMLYANGYATTTACRADGSGSRLLQLSVNVSECGIRFLQSDDGSRQLDLSLYLQYDHHVQQAVDEQVTTRCRLPSDQVYTDPTPNDIHRSSVVFSALEKASRRNDQIAASPSKIITTTVLPSGPLLNSTASTVGPAKTPGLPLTSYQAKKLEMNRESKLSAPPSLVTSGVLKLHHNSPSTQQKGPANQDTISCWMDIVAGADPHGKPVETFLRVGQDATVVVKVRQTAGLDTRLTGCVAHDGSHEAQQELLDSDGCSVDTSILPNVQERIISRSGAGVVKIFYANFQAFRFPDRDHLHLKCTVVVCKGKCLMNPCNLIRRKGRQAIPPGVEGKGQLGSFRPLSAQEMAESQVRPASSVRTRPPNDRSLLGQSSSSVIRRSGSTRSSNLTTTGSLVGSLQHQGSIVDRVDVFNSVEVRVSASPTSHTSNSLDDKSLRGYSSRSTSGLEELYSAEEDAIFCLTPSKLFMAFGILFAVLISAMLFAICVCVRIRTSKAHLKKLTAVQQQHVNPYSASPQRYLSPSPRPPATPFNPAFRHPSSLSSRYQVQTARHNSASPYVRVFK